MDTINCDNGWGKLPRCPGSYCGRTLSDGVWSDCGSCLRGMYRNDLPANSCSECVRCEDAPDLYDWLFLLFMAGVSFTLNCFYVEYTNPKKTPYLLLLHASAFLESAAAAVVTLLLFDPIGRVSLTSCRPNKLQDWYTMFHNPYNITNNLASHYETLHCTHERVYPLYSIVLIFYGFCLVFLLLFRPFISSCFVLGKGRKSIYAALYFYPILIVIHAAGGGLIYFCYPYLTLLLSLVTIAVHFTAISHMDREQNLKTLVLESVKTPRYIAIVFAHWLAHAFGIITILVARVQSESNDVSQQFSNIVPYLPILVAVPVPTLFYILTAKFTDPHTLQLMD